MVLKASIEDIRTAGVKLASYAADYQDSVKSLYQIVDELRNNWQGSDNQSFVSTVNGYKENIQALGQVINNYGEFLQLTANSLQKLQDDISQQASNL